MRRNVLLLLFYSLVVSAEAQISSPVLDIADSLSKFRIFEYDKINITHENSKLWLYASNLDSIATTEELYLLLNNRSPIVRCYSFIALCNRKEDVFDFLINNLNDYEFLSSLHYDLPRGFKVSDFYISHARDILNNNQITQLDSILIFDEESKLEWRIHLVSQLTPHEKYYKVVRKLASEGNQTALVTLAKYQKKEDKELILRDYSINDNNALIVKAIREYPDLEFYPYLIKKYKRNWSDRYHYWSEWRMLYQALAQYPDQKQTVKYYNKTLKIIGRFKRQMFSTFMKVAILRYPNPIFDPILEKIDLEEHFERDVIEFLEMDQ